MFMRDVVYDPSYSILGMIVALRLLKYSTQGQLTVNTKCIPFK